jgi:putative endonuclease
VTKDIGKRGEEYAEKLLLKNGYRIVTRNFKIKFGEIDIIAVKDNTLVFVEVKTRRSSKFGLPVEAITPQKVAKIKKVGEVFVKCNGKNLPSKLRVDGVSLVVSDDTVIAEKIYVGD